MLRCGNVEGGMRDWTDRLNAPGEAIVRPSTRSVVDIVAGQAMLLPTARQVDALMRDIPAGQSLDVRTFRRQLAARHGAEVTCPVWVGYHLRTVAEAAYESLQRGQTLNEITPFWRVLDAKTPTTPRLACGAGFVAERRAAEGLAP